MTATHHHHLTVVLLATIVFFVVLLMSGPVASASLVPVGMEESVGFVTAVSAHL